MSTVDQVFEAARAAWAKDPERHLRALARRQPLPVVRISGRSVPLAFTWFGVSPFGSRRIHDMLVAATDGQPGCGRALADLLEVASAGWIRAEDVMSGRVRVPYAEALSALSIAWTTLRRGPPKATPQRWWERALKQPLRIAVTQPADPAPDLSFLVRQ